MNSSSPKQIDLARSHAFCDVFSSMSKPSEPVVGSESGHRPRELVDVLKDPDAEWCEIRESLKSQGGATNGGLVCAIAAATSTRRASIESMTTVKASNESFLDHLENRACINLKRKEDEEDSLFTEKKVGRIRKSALLNPRRRYPSMRSSATGNDICSVNSSLASVNMMDFGVEHSIMLSFTHHSRPSREALNETASDTDTMTSNSTFGTNGFMGWKHDDESCNDQSEGIRRNNGIRTRQDTRLNEKQIRGNEGNGEEATAGAVENKRSSWHLEDYDFDPSTEDAHSPDSGSADAPNALFTPFKRQLSEPLKRISQESHRIMSLLSRELNTCTDPTPCKEAITTEEVRQALLDRLEITKTNRRSSM